LPGQLYSQNCDCAAPGRKLVSPVRCADTCTWSVYISIFTSRAAVKYYGVLGYKDVQFGKWYQCFRLTCYLRLQDEWSRILILTSGTHLQNYTVIYQMTVILPLLTCRSQTMRWSPGRGVWCGAGDCWTAMVGATVCPTSTHWLSTWSIPRSVGL
jgi:hypothetical protein